MIGLHGGLRGRECKGYDVLYWDLIDRLKGLLGLDRVVTEEGEVRRYSQDALTPSRASTRRPFSIDAATCW